MSGERIITREDFMKVCPETLKKRIEDFFIYYSEKKKTTSYVPNDSNKKYISNGPNNSFKNPKKPSTNNFRKPFEKSIDNTEKITIDFKGILSKVNENNLDAIWNELVAMKLEQYIVSDVPKPIIETKVEEGWTKVGTTKSIVEPNKELFESFAKIMYQYTRTCNMYLKQYVDIVNRMKKNKDLSIFSTLYINHVMNDIINLKEDKESNLLSHQILNELAILALVSKKTYIDYAIQKPFERIQKREGNNFEEPLEILIQNIKKLYKLIQKQKDVIIVMESFKEWKEQKVFSGKHHFLLVDILSEQ